MASDFSKASNQIVIDLINEANSTPLALNVVDLGLPTANGEGAARNTSVTVTAKVGSGYKDAVTVTYNRLQISGFTEEQITLPVGDAVNISDLIPELNSALGVNLQPGEFTDGPIPAFQGGVANETVDVEIVISADSLAYLGSITIKVKADDISLQDIVTVTELDGLEYPA